MYGMNTSVMRNLPQQGLEAAAMANTSIESQYEIIPLRDGRKKMLQRLLSKIVPWENATVSTNDFPEFIDENTRVLLKECVASHLKQSEFRKYRSALKSSSHRILLQSIPGTELYRERLVTAIAKELQVPLLKLDCLDYGDEDDNDGDGDNNNEEEEEDDDDDESEEEVQALEKGNQEVEEDRRGDEEEQDDDTSDGDEDNNNREEVHRGGGGGGDNDDDDKSEEEVQALEKGNEEVEEDHRGQEEEEEDDAASDVDEDNSNGEDEEDNNREEVHGGGDDNNEEEEEDDDDDDDDDDEEEEDDDDEESEEEVQVCALEKGDRVKYVGKDVRFPELNNRSLSSGQEGEVREVNGGRVGVVFNICDLKPAKKAKKERGLLTWLQATDVTKYRDAKTHDLYVARKLLQTVVESNHPIIVYLPLCFSWTWTDICSAEEVFDQFQQGVVIICAQDEHDDSTPKETDKYQKVYKKKYTRGRRWHDSEIRRYAFMWPFYNSDIHGDQGAMRRVFTNVFSIKPPQDRYLLNKLITQIEQDMRPLMSQRNLHKIHKVLKLHDLSCTSLEHANLGDKILSKEEVGKIVGWAENHYLSSCKLPCVKEEKLDIPYQSIEVAHSRLNEGETQPIKQSKNIKDLASNSSEEKLVSAVVDAEDIGVKFEDVGALENVKKTLYETVILPLRRPELFSRGNLLKPCKGILLFGPPGTGKTLIAKALATESGAHFINITSATITSKWVGETENLTRALFSFATKLAPVIIFVDEVDSLFGVRGCNEYDTSRMNEFMAAWDGFTSKDSQRITVIGATNRPFDLDEAVLRRMPRRIYVGLPDAKNRSKILKILLKEENLESGFSFEQLAQATPGYSGSDLKNLCIAAAYRPIEELLEQESKGEKSQAIPAPALRPLNLNDFLCSKAKVKPSVSSNMQSIIKLRIWNEQYGQGDGEDDIAWN